MPVHKKVNKDFFKTWTPQMAYVLGFFAADGYITVNKRGGQFWSIQITDLDLLQKIQKALESNHRIGVRIRKGNENTLYRLQIGSKEMCDDLRKLGFLENKTYRLAVPEVPSEFLPEFTRGYFDGDGNVWSGFVHKDRAIPLLTIRTVFTSCSKDFLQNLQDRLGKQSIEKGVLSKTAASVYRLTYSIHGTLKLYDFMYNHEVHKYSSLFLLRKKRIFEKFITLRS